MFTFGREHEIKCAIRRHRKEDELQIVLAIINAIHDFKDGIVPSSALNAIRKGLWTAPREHGRHLAVGFAS